MPSVTSMPATYAPIRIVLQKSQNPVDDDKLIIIPNEEDGYDVTFHNNTVSVVHTRYVETDDIMDYLENFFDAVQYDKSPYMFVQVDMPSYPPILLTPSDVEDYMYVIEQQILGMEEDWPMQTLLPIKPATESKKNSKSKKSKKHVQTDSKNDDMDEIVRIILGLNEPSSCTARSCCN